MSTIELERFDHNKGDKMMSKKTGKDDRYLQVPYKYMQHKELNLTGAVVLARIADYTTMKRGYCCASNETLAEELGLSKATVSNTIQTLEDKGMITVDGGQGKRRHLFMTKEATKISEDDTAETTSEDLVGGSEDLSVNLLNFKSPLSTPSTKKEERDEAGSVALVAPSPLREQTPILPPPSTTTLLSADPIGPEFRAKMEAEAQALADAEEAKRQQAAADRINRMHAEAKAKAGLGLPTSYPQCPAPELPPTTIPMPTSFPQEPAPSLPVPSASDTLARMKARTAEVAKTVPQKPVNDPSFNPQTFLQKLRSGQLNQAKPGSEGVTPTAEARPIPQQRDAATEPSMFRGDGSFDKDAWLAHIKSLPPRPAPQPKPVVVEEEDDGTEAWYPGSQDGDTERYDKDGELV